MRRVSGPDVRAFSHNKKASVNYTFLSSEMSSREFGKLVSLVENYQFDQILFCDMLYSVTVLIHLRANGRCLTKTF